MRTDTTENSGESGRSLIVRYQFLLRRSALHITQLRRYLHGYRALLFRKNQETLAQHWSGECSLRNEVVILPVHHCATPTFDVIFKVIA